MSSLNFHSTFVLTVQRLVSACTCVFLKGDNEKVFNADARRLTIATANNHFSNCFLVMYLEGVAGKFFGTKIAACPPLGASIFQVVLHQYTRYHCTTFITAWNCIVFAGVQVSLLFIIYRYYYLFVIFCSFVCFFLFLFLSRSFFFMHIIFIKGFYLKEGKLLRYL